MERGINTKVYRYQQPPSVDKLRHKEYLSVYTDLIKFEDKETQMKNGISVLPSFEQKQKLWVSNDFFRQTCSYKQEN